MSKFKFSNFPKEAILKIKAIFPDGGSLRYQSVGALDQWMTVIDTFEDFNDHGNIFPGDLIRVIPCNPVNWIKPYHNEVVFLIFNDQEESEKKETTIRCCRIIEKFQSHFKISGLSDSDKVFDLYFSQIALMWSLVN